MTLMKGKVGDLLVVQDLCLRLSSISCMHNGEEAVLLSVIVTLLGTNSRFRGSFCFSFLMIRL